MASLIIHLKGGTGNQLFQAAAALSLACIYKKNCEFTIENINKNKYKRELEIKDLLGDIGVNEKNIKTKNPTIYLDQYDIDHPLYYSNISPLALLEKDIQLEGDFTNYRIHQKEVITKIKSFMKTSEMASRFKQIDFIAIHLRELHGSGSKNIKKELDNLNINYYSQALNQIINDNSVSEIRNAIVFSDMCGNPSESKLLPQIKNILKDLDINYINGDSEIKSPIDIVKIFTFSKFSIISNSTLSWWGAYLSEGKIYCPVMNLWEPNLKVPDHWKQIYSGEITPRTHHNAPTFSALIRNKRNTNNKIFNAKRLFIIKLFRKILSVLYSISLFKSYNKLTQYIGLFPENHNKTFI